MGKIKKVPRGESDQVKKKYWYIGEIASEHSISTSRIRFWEDEGLLKRPKLDRKGNRRYNEVQKEELDLIISVMKQGCYTIKGGKELLLPLVKNIINKVPKRLRITDKIDEIILKEATKIWNN